MSAQTLYRVDPTRNMRRFYRLDVQPDLFGFYLFVREWGRIGRAGQTREAAFLTAEAAQDVLERQRQTKERRGYTETMNAPGALTPTSSTDSVGRSPLPTSTGVHGLPVVL